MINWISVKDALPHAQSPQCVLSDCVLIRTQQGHISFGVLDIQDNDWFPAHVECECNTALFINVTEGEYFEIQDSRDIAITHWALLNDVIKKPVKVPCRKCGKRGCVKCKRCGDKICEGQPIDFVFNDDEEGDITKEVVCPKCRAEWDVLDATTGYKELVQKRTKLFNEFFDRE